MPQPLSVALRPSFSLAPSWLKPLRLPFPTTMNCWRFLLATLRYGGSWTASMVPYTPKTCIGGTFGTPQSVKTTSIPTLGLVHIDSSLQASATAAMFSDNCLFPRKQHGTRPHFAPGSMQWTLASSPYWGAELKVDGAVLWRLHPEGDAEPRHLSGIDEEDCSACTVRAPWRDHKFRDPMMLGEDRPFLPEGNRVPSSSNLQRWPKRCALPTKSLAQIEAFSESATGLERSYHALQIDPGYHENCFAVENTSELTEVARKWGQDASKRLNPLGLSGRDTVLIDQTGVKLQWLTWSMAS